MEPDPDRRAAWLTFAIVGAGPTGVEMAGQIAELARDTLRLDFDAVDPRNGRILLIEAPRPGADELPALAVGEGATVARAAWGHADARLDRRRRSMTESVTISDGAGADPAHPGAHRHLGRRRDGVEARGEAGRADRSRTRPCRPGRGRADLTLPGHPEVFALGDMVRVRGADGEIVDLSRGRAGRRCSRAATSPGSCSAGSSRATPRRSTTTTRATWRRSGAGAAVADIRAVQAERPDRLAHLGGRPPLVPGRVREPLPRLHPLVVQLRHARPRRAADHRIVRGSDRRRSLSAGAGCRRTRGTARHAGPPRSSSPSRTSCTGRRSPAPASSRVSSRLRFSGVGFGSARRNNPESHTGCAGDLRRRELVDGQREPVPCDAHDLHVLDRTGRTVQDESVGDLGGEAAGRALRQRFGGNMDLVVAHRVRPYEVVRVGGDTNTRGPWFVRSR